MNWTDSLAPLRERNFAWYYAARFASMTGSMMVTVALAFAVLDISGSASALGLVLAAHTIPMVLFLLFGGVIYTAIALLTLTSRSVRSLERLSIPSAQRAS